MKPSLRNTVGRSLLLFFFCVTLFSKGNSQHITIGGERVKLEIGLNFGPTFFLGDLGGNHGYGTTFIKDVNLELTKMMKGGFITAYPKDWLGIRLAGQITYIAGQDNLIDTKGVNELWRKQRNLDFKSTMWEAYGAIEIYPTMLFKKYDDYDPFLSPYGFIGLGVFHFDPKGSITDGNGVQTWHKLHPLRTEGQGMAEYPLKKPYSLTQFNIPLGAGLRVRVSSRYNVSTELLYRKTFTDYIDDVSTTYIDPVYFDKYLTPDNAIIARKIHDKTVGIVTPGVNRYEPGTQRGNHFNMDAYFSFVLKIGIRIGPVYENATERNQANQRRCPHFY
ncbi:MAG TPA: hypothetical protein VK498_01660 [Ferruginibacter sp.]|nr:hypothetical protein [Ferruginibacter sp.]